MRNDMIGLSPAPQINCIKEDNRERECQGDSNDLEKMTAAKVSAGAPLKGKCSEPQQSS